MTSPTNLIWLAREAEGTLIGPGVALLSMLNPVMAAEEAATLDWITEVVGGL
jgi:alkanesulfonate monooxygenase SsuD/methylene tetrahydromethanopterin reductase-like flavin-dependent oxidoreductase (luciferase family)